MQDKTSIEEGFKMLKDLSFLPPADEDLDAQIQSSIDKLISKSKVIKKANLTLKRKN